jgi:hypothetical protein
MRPGVETPGYYSVTPSGSELVLDIVMPRDKLLSFLGRSLRATCDPNGVT